MKFFSILIVLTFLSSWATDIPRSDYRKVLKQIVDQAHDQLKRDITGGDLTVRQKEYGQTVIKALDALQKQIGDASTTNSVYELSTFVKQVESAHKNPEIRPEKKTT